MIFQKIGNVLAGLRDTLGTREETVLPGKRHLERASAAVPILQGGVRAQEWIIEYSRGVIILRRVQISQETLDIHYG